MLTKNKEIGEVFNALEQKYILTPRNIEKIEKTPKTPIEIAKELKSFDDLMDFNFSCLEEFFNKLNLPLIIISKNPATEKAFAVGNISQKEINQILEEYIKPKIKKKIIKKIYKKLKKIYKNKP